MPKFTLTIQRSTLETAEVEIEAPTKQEAMARIELYGDCPAPKTDWSEVSTDYSIL